LDTSKQSLYFFWNAQTLEQDTSEEIYLPIRIFIMQSKQSKILSFIPRCIYQGLGFHAILTCKGKGKNIVYNDYKFISDLKSRPGK